MDFAPSRQPDARRETLVDLLEREPGRFEPVTALRVAQAAATDGDEIALLTGVGVAPAALAVSGFKREGKIRTIRTALAGLTGPLGSMPAAYNELILREERNRSKGLARFFDLFNARIAELFADASEKYRLARQLRWGGRREDNGFLTALFALTGFGTNKLKTHIGIDEDILLRFSGIFASRNRNAASLRAMLTEFTGLPVEVELFRGRWVTIPLQERSKMGPTQGVQLGVNATAGTAVKDFSGGFRLVLGPLSYQEYRSLSPGRRSMAEIFALTRLYVGAALEFDVQIILKKEEIPFCQFGSATEAGLSDPPRLGWNSWARVAPAENDSADAVIVEAHSAAPKGGGHAA